MAALTAHAGPLTAIDALDSAVSQRVMPCSDPPLTAGFRDEGSTLSPLGVGGVGGVIVPRTGQRATSPGTYASDCGSQWTVHMKQVGDEFPPCPHCRRAVYYKKVG